MNGLPFFYFRSFLLHTRGPLRCVCVCEVIPRFSVDSIPSARISPSNTLQ